jgi:hypothetical protein
MHTELGYNLDKNQIQLFLAKMIDKGLDHSGAGSDSSGAHCQKPGHNLFKF